MELARVRMQGTPPRWSSAFGPLLMTTTITELTAGKKAQYQFAKVIEAQQTHPNARYDVIRVNRKTGAKIEGDTPIPKGTSAKDWDWFEVIVTD